MFTEDGGGLEEAGLTEAMGVSFVISFRTAFEWQLHPQHWFPSW